ncbi:MAG: hypothetical protein Q8M01_05365 [Rubrivivax sp.]|nr:hypothetical protein [Rubrivivax sp.]
MKPGDTRWHAQDIAAQPALRNMQPMHTEPSNRLATRPLSARTRLLRSVLAALLLGAGAAHAADTQETAVERPLDLSLPRDMPAKAGPIKKPGDGRIDSKPYGSGYEARRLNATRNSAASAAEPDSAGSSGAASAGLRGAATGSAARAARGGHRSGGTGGRGRR